MANSVDPDQTAPIGAVCSASTLFASILNSSVICNVRLLFAADDFRGQHFQMHFFLGALRVNNKVETETNSDVNMLVTAITLLASCTGS